MEVWAFIFAAVGAVGALIAIPSAIYALAVSRRQATQGTAIELGREIIQMAEFREKVVTIFRDVMRDVLEQAKVDSRAVAIDQIQLHLNREIYITAPQYNSDIENINRRLDSLDAQVTDIPRRTADQVLLAIKRKDVDLT